MMGSPPQRIYSKGLAEIEFALNKKTRLLNASRAF